MSYEVNHSVRISGTADGTVDYPASESGGSTHASFEWSEDVNINILVDTSPFDHSVENCKLQLGILTGGIAAAGVAYVMAKTQSAIKISTAIISGFYNLIRQELRQQMTELGTKMPMLLSELKRRAEDCIEKRKQMQCDFERISGRYSALFSDLDKNLESSVRQLDQPCFSLFEHVRTAVTSTLTDSLSAEALVTAGEIATSDSKLTIASVKGTADSIIRSIRRTIANGRQLRNDVKEILAANSLSQKEYVFAPVLVIECDDLDDETCCQVSVCAPEPLKKSAIGEQVENALSALSATVKMEPLSAREAANVDAFLKRGISAWVSGGGGEQSLRMSAEMVRIWNVSVGGLNS